MKEWKKARKKESTARAVLIHSTTRNSKRPRTLQTNEIKSCNSNTQGYGKTCNNHNTDVGWMVTTTREKNRYIHRSLSNSQQN